MNATNSVAINVINTIPTIMTNNLSTNVTSTVRINSDDEKV